MANSKESHLQKNSEPTIHRASWVVAGLSSDGNRTGHRVIEDGAIVMADGLITAVGKYNQVIKAFAGCHIREHENCVLAPALINSHAHLELSYLDLAEGDGENTFYAGDPTAWIRDLLQKKERFYAETADVDETILSHAREALQHMHTDGVAFVGDIGNSLASRFIGQQQETSVFFLLELLGLSAESEKKAFARLDELLKDQSSHVACTAHAPYSTTPALISAIKKRADLLGHVFSIHTAESLQEVGFLQTGSGYFRDFLQERGAWDGSFAIPGKGSVEYLENLGVLNEKTLCVHAVHVDRREIEILARSKAKICLCPGSNRFLGVGIAPVTEFIAHGILPALGTDSKASNPVLNMWREMRILREDHPGLSPETVFEMATCGGAEAWGISGELGTIEPGKKAHVLTVGCNEQVATGDDVFEFLTTIGESAQVDWLL